MGAKNYGGPSTQHCCFHERDEAGVPLRVLPDPTPCRDSCEGLICPRCFALLEHNDDYLDGAVSLAPARRAQPKCAFCRNPVRIPKRGATGKFCGPKCRAEQAKVDNAARLS